MNIFWFRRDLRLEDNHGLYQALQGENNVMPIFIFDTVILNQLQNKNDRRVNFIYQSLDALHLQLKKFNSSLKVLIGEPLECFEKLIQEFQVKKIFFNLDYEPYATKRDHEIKLLSEKNSIEFLGFKDHVVFEKNEILKPDGTPYTVYTPYSNKWKKKISETKIEEYNIEGLKNNFLQQKFDFPKLETIGFNKIETNFLSQKTDDETLIHYHKNRDIPSIEGTSNVSMYLRFGTISTRKMVKLALLKNPNYLNELIWREFFISILWHFPFVENRAFKKKYNLIQWLNSEEEFKAWCKGETGFPIVDAGMRQLNATGYMHNRVRMIVANFLTKILLIDWKWGEAYFADNLNDFELAANNGNWQWSAACGCDAAPYFRIFNPTTQQEKFDPNFEYIKKWIPNFEPNTYIQPIVNYNFCRTRALTFFKTQLNETV